MTWLNSIIHDSTINIMHLKDILLAPIYLYQGSQLKRTALRLPEAVGVRSGQASLTRQDVDNTNNATSTLNLMIVGDSSAAGVGVDKQEDALVGQLIAKLKRMDWQQTAYNQLKWSLHAKSGDTSFDSLRRLYVIARQPIDIMVIVVGVNDTTSSVNKDTWRNQIHEIIATSQRKFGVKHIIFSCLPPMQLMPALPSPLNHFIGAKSDKLDHILQLICHEYRQVSYLSVDFKEADMGIDKMFAKDGFHPSATAYTFWAGKLANQIAKVL